MNKYLPKEFVSVNYEEYELKAVALHIKNLEDKGYYISGRECPECNESATMIQNASVIRTFCLNCNKIVIEEGYDF